MANVKNYFEQADADGDNPLHLTGDNNVLVPAATEKKLGTWIDGKTIYTKTISVGTLPNTTAKSVAHGITGLNLRNYIKIDFAAYASGVDAPFAGVGPGVIVNGTGEIRMNIDSTNVTITTLANFTFCDSCYVTLYYTKA